MTRSLSKLVAESGLEPEYLNLNPDCDFSLPLSLKYRFFFNFCTLLVSSHFNQSSAEAFLSLMLCIVCFCLDFFFLSFPLLICPFSFPPKSFLAWKMAATCSYCEAAANGNSHFTEHNCLWAGAGPAGTKIYKWTISSQVVDWSWLFLLLPRGDRSGKAKH